MDGKLIEANVIIEALMKISSAIEDLYQRLCMMEISGQKGSEEYHKVLDYLDMSIDHEETIYQENQLNAFKARELIDIIIKNYINNKMVSDTECIISKNYHNAYIRRIINILTNIMKSDYDGMYQILEDDLFEIKESQGIDYLYQLTSVQKFLMEDYIARVFLLLQDEINQSNDDKLKHKLIRDKYFIAFIFSQREKGHNNDLLVIPNKVCNSAKTIGFFSFIDEEHFKRIQNDFLMKEIRNIIFKIALKEDSNKLIYERKILLECFIRSLFMMLDDECKRELLKEVNLISLPFGLEMKEILRHINECTKEDKIRQITLKIR